MKGMSKFFGLAGLFFLLTMPAVSQKAKYQTDIVYRLSQYIEWPEYNEQYKFVIGVVGNADDFESFQRMALERHAMNGRPIEVRYFECTDAIDACQLLYVSDQCDIKIDKIVKKAKSNPILIVTAKDGYGEAGSVINFVEESGKLKFELNEEQALKRGLLVSEQLQNIAVVI
jgi:hypothetical protein